MLIFHFYTPRTVVCHGFLFYLFILNFDLLILKKMDIWKAVIVRAQRLFLLQAA